MNAEMIALGVETLALALTAGVIAAAFYAVTARSLFAMCVALVAAGALAAGALLALGAGGAALGQALFGVALAPVILLAALLLSSRAVKPARGGRPWLTIAAASAVAAAILWGAPELAGPSTARVAPAPAAPITPWIAPLIFVAAAACVGLLGFGERGALERLPDIDE